MVVELELLLVVLLLCLLLCLLTTLGNPSSSHQYGVQTKKLVEKSRQHVAELLGCNNDEVVFTSGGTESNNYAIKGTAYAQR